MTACSEPTAVDNSPSSFSANLTGSTTGRLTGSATATAGGNWAHEGIVQVTSAGLRESHPHDVTITREAPNYSA